MQVQVRKLNAVLAVIAGDNIMGALIDRDQFLAGRKKGIGGSDVAAILGFSPYKSPYQLWLDKTGRSERKVS